MWHVISAHFEFQKAGGRSLDFADFKLDHDEKPENFYQRLTAFIDNNLLAQGDLKHHGDSPTADEELSPTLENMVVVQWLRLINDDCRGYLNRYTQRLTMSSLIDKSRPTEEIKVIRSAPFTFQNNRDTQSRTCPLCREAGRMDVRHYLSKCKYLPDSDRNFLTKARHVTCEEDPDGDNTDMAKY